MKKYVFILLISLFMLVIPVNAQRGCCSHHGGVTGCSNGRQVCSDGTYSPTCTCASSTPSVSTSPSVSTTPVTSTSYVSGCTDSSAINYNKSANKNDGSCQYKKTVSTTEAVPFDKTYEEDSSLKFNEEVVTTEGTDGVRTITYEVILDSNNKEISRKEISNEITTPKVDQIIKRNSQAVADDTNNKKSTSGDNTFAGFIETVVIIGVLILIIKKIFKKKI